MNLNVIQLCIQTNRRLKQVYSTDFKYEYLKTFVKPSKNFLLQSETKPRLLHKQTQQKKLFPIKKQNFGKRFKSFSVRNWQNSTKLYIKLQNNDLKT